MVLISSTVDVRTCPRIRCHSVIMFSVLSTNLDEDIVTFDLATSFPLAFDIFLMCQDDLLKVNVTPLNNVSYIFLD